MTQLIKLTQAPIIDFSKVEEVGKQVQADLAKYNIDNVVANDETLKDIKALRAKFNKESKEFEDARKAIKTAVNDPYKQFEDAYKLHIINRYKEADIKLKSVIDEIEDKQREAKTNELKEEFTKQVEKAGIDFVTFEQVGLNITLSASMKSLVDTITTFIERIKNELILIDSQYSKERILVRYKQTLNVSQSIISVKQEIEQEEASKLKVVEEPKQVEEVVIDPIAPQPTPIEELLTITFTAQATKTQLIELRNYMEREGIEYE